MSPFLMMHIAAGSLAFATGTIALLARKGATVHRRVGMVFFVSMLVMSSSALYLSILHQPGTIFSTDQWLEAKFVELRELLHDPLTADEATALSGSNSLTFIAMFSASRYFPSLKRALYSFIN